MTIAPAVCNTGRGSPQPTDGEQPMQLRRLIACVYVSLCFATLPVMRAAYWLT